MASGEGASASQAALLGGTKPTSARDGACQGGQCHDLSQSANDPRQEDSRVLEEHDGCLGASDRAVRAALQAGAGSTRAFRVRGSFITVTGHMVEQMGPLDKVAPGPPPVPRRGAENGGLEVGNVSTRSATTRPRTRI